jgi:hypothetical protein
VTPKELALRVSPSSGMDIPNQDVTAHPSDAFSLAFGVETLGSANSAGFLLRNQYVRAPHFVPDAFPAKTLARKRRKSIPWKT